MEDSPKKSLGQYWLTDESILSAVPKTAVIGKNDFVLEIGPGQGALTDHLLKSSKKVIAVELDSNLASKLAEKFAGSNLEIINADILKFDFSQLPTGYKIVANIPYYLTGHLLRIIGETSNPPVSATLLVQKEVAERIDAKPGKMSLLSVGVQYYFTVDTGAEVPATAFSPVPKVNSKFIHLTRRSNPPFSTDTKLYFRLVKAGFANRRKKLRSSLSAGLGIPKNIADEMLVVAGIDGNLRAQDLSLEDWKSLAEAYVKI